MNWRPFALLSLAAVSLSQLLAQGPPAPSPTPAPEVSPVPVDENIVPTFETQKLARTYILDIPAPRGEIIDRNGAPLAQNRLSYNLAINFPTPLEFNDDQVLEFAHQQIAAAAKLIGRQMRVADETILRHYHNRGILPLEIAQNLSEQEYAAAKGHSPPEMTLRGVYVRVYPNGKTAGQIIGYTGRTGRNADGIIDNNETIWPDTEGREGIEQTFNAMLAGKHGNYKMTFDKDGRKTSEKIVSPPVPGHTVVTTLDLRLQDLDMKNGSIVVERLKGSLRTSQALTEHRGEPLLNEVKALRDWLRQRIVSSPIGYCCLRMAIGCWRRRGSHGTCTKRFRIRHRGTLQNFG